ncbi:unnamed protein product [Parnassius apollo]|uniref:(apollo) hypothetical protein n=1 Tax=Parnassius apollo TaxID=110799 RepID=A0A8S3XK11_PARAO|nr:unnamed protein product [Parnassius apollo]
MSAEITLVQEIQKYPCLYNNNLPEYNRKDLTEEAWAEVAHNNNLTVSECKEKWRNIRCSFLRSLKPSAKYKKPYYLTAYLQFVLPFMKSLNNLEIVEESQANETLKKNSTKDIMTSTVKSEPEEDFEELSEGEHTSMEIPVTMAETISAESLISRQQTTAFRKRRRPTSLPKTFTDKKNKKAKYSQGQMLKLVSADSNRGNNNAMRYFLLSLLPEFETMSDEQIRLFKIKVMLLIDELKTNDTRIRQSINNGSDSERLHKRLINLLLRNLKKSP